MMLMDMAEAIEQAEAGHKQSMIEKVMRRKDDEIKRLQNIIDNYPANFELQQRTIEKLERDNEAQKVLIDNFKLDDLMDIFKRKLEEEIVVTLQTGIHRGLLEAAGIAEKVCREFASPKIGYACKTAIINKVASEI